jgi:glycosyltransferase involved in cell wall biosynthesis
VSPRVAITTDWLTTFGGGERVLQQLRILYPAAPIYTSVFTPANLPPDMRGWDVRPSMLQRFPLVHRYSRALLPLMPMAFDAFDFREYDVVIAMSSAFSKNINTSGETRSVCYCLTPPRYLWDLTGEYLGGTARLLAAPLLKQLRDADLAAARRADQFVAISQTVADRVKRWYARDSEIIHPPVETDRVRPNGRAAEDFYLVVSRLVGYKRVDLAIEACNRLKRRLLVVGTGKEDKRLRSIAGPTIEFLGAQSDEVVVDLYARAKAFLFPGFEDFGIAPIEAQSAGRPVVAYHAGGVAETVVSGATGVFFGTQSVDAMVEAMMVLDRTEIDPAACRASAERFAAPLFRERMQRFLETSPVS